MNVAGKCDLQIPIDRALQPCDGLFSGPAFGQDIQIDAFRQISTWLWAVTP
jgi:hypothetical protein